ncbi:hypothetical protein CJT70_33510, partial [Pseudomonas aeruginosa]
MRSSTRRYSSCRECCNRPRAVSLDPDSFLANPQLEVRLNALSRQSSLYKRDTGIDGLYLG